MTVPLLQLPRTLTVDANGEPRSGAKLYVFAAQTSNAVQVWQDPNLTIPHAVPIVSNGEGTFPPIYSDPSLGDIKINITDAEDIQIPGYPLDNIPAPFAASANSIGALLYPLSLAEKSAGIVPLTSFPQGSLRRYGADPTGVLPSDAALTAALSCNSDVFDDYPGGGTYLFNTGVTISSFPVTIRGQARWVSGASGVVSGTKFILSSTVSQAAILGTKTSIYGLKIQGIGFTFAPGGTTQQYAISFGNDLRYSIIEDCAFFAPSGQTGQPLVGIAFAGSTVFSGGVIIRDNFFDGLFACASLAGACTTIKFYGNECYGYNGKNAVNTFTFTPGSGYTDGAYRYVVPTGSAIGTEAEFEVTVAAGVVTNVVMVFGGNNYAASDVLTTTSIGGGTGFAITVVTVGAVDGFGISLAYPVSEPLIGFNYFEGFTCGVYSDGAAYLKQIANDYAVNVNHFVWGKTSYARIWNQSLGETFGGGLPGNLVYPFNNNDACQVLSGGTYSLDGSSVAAYRGFMEQGRAVANGHQQTRAFSAGNYAGATGVWTVISSEVVADCLVVDGNHATYYFEVSSSTVSGTPTALQITLPAGIAATFRSTTPIRVVNNGTTATGFAEILANASVISLYADSTAGTAWANSTTNTTVQGQIGFPINGSIN